MTNEEIIELAGHREVPPWVIKLVGDAVDKEREACANLCDEYDDGRHANYAESCARAIRLRGQE